jgi:hypothetical protein
LVFIIGTSQRQAENSQPTVLNLKLQWSGGRVAHGIHTSYYGPCEKFERVISAQKDGSNKFHHVSIGNGRQRVRFVVLAVSLEVRLKICEK